MSGALKWDEWETVRLGDLITESSVRNKKNEDIPVYSVTNDLGFCTGYFSKDVSSKDKSTYKIVPYGSFAYNPSRINVGSVAWQSCEERVIISPLYVVFKVSEKVDKQYLLHYLKSDVIQTYIRALASGSVRDNLKFSILQEFQFTLRPLPEQKRIANILDKIASLISLRKTQLEKLDELVKARFVEMFGDVELNPNEYPIKNFEEISVLITDGEHATPLRTEKGIYLLSARNVLNHALQLNDVDYIDEDEYNRIARRVTPQAGDVLISCSGSIGRCCVVPAGLKFQMVRSMALIRFDDTINPIFAEWLITSDELQRQIVQSSTQSSQANLFQGKIRKLHGYVPPMELQNQFASFVKQTDKSKSIIQQSLDTLETLKKSLMQEYFG